MFEALLLLAQAAAPAPATAATSPWMVTERAGANGTRSASTSATEPGGARLAVRCDRTAEPVVSIQFLPRTRLRLFGVQPVTLQVDGGTLLVDNWELIGGGAIERVDAAVSTITAAVARGHAVKLRSFDATGTAIDLNFPGPASDAPIRRVLAACGFTLGQPFVRAPQPAPATAPAI